MKYLDDLIDEEQTIKDAVKKSAYKGNKKLGNNKKSQMILEEEPEENFEEDADEELNKLMEQEKNIVDKEIKNSKANKSNKKLQFNNTNKQNKMYMKNEYNNKTKNNKNNKFEQQNYDESYMDDDYEQNEEFNDNNQSEDMKETNELDKINDELLTDQGPNEDTLLENNNKIFDNKFVAHKKREKSISPHSYQKVSTKVQNKEDMENKEEKQLISK